MGTPVNVTRQANPGPLYAGRFPPAPPVAAPVAEFIGSPTSGTAPFTVTFTDQSTGSVTGWAWDFGDGSSSSSQNPTHNFTAAGSYTVALTATGPGGSNTRTRMAYVSAAAPTVPTTATLSGSESASVGSPHTSRVTLDQPADQTYTVTWTRSDSGTGSATSTITAGNTYVEATDTWAAIGSGRTVDFTISPTLTRVGRPLTVTVADFAWAFADAGTLNLAANTTTTIATGVPGGAIAEVSPDLPPGLTLQITGTDLEVVGDSTVPTIDGSSSGSVLDLASGVDHTFEVLDSAIATIVNVTQSITYAPGSYPMSSQGATRWGNVMGALNPGDVLEVSPGAIQQEGESGNYFSGLDSSLLAIWKPNVTIRKMTGRGRWSLYPVDTALAGTAHGICIYSPTEIGGQGSFDISGFAFDNWGGTSGSNGIRIRNDTEVASAWTHFHTALSLSDFKIGKAPYYKSASGVNGGAYTMTLVNGHIYDTGDGAGGAAGNDHNAYISAHTMNVFGMRFQRSRGSNADGSSTMDGHMLKASAVNALIEGCCFDADPEWGDNTHHIQAKAGGNFIIRGCLFVDSVRNQSQGRGPITMLREYGGTGLPNFEWWAGSEGNSLLIEKNVFVGHYGRGVLYFFPVGAADTGYMASGSAEDEISAVTVRDNIAMITATPTVLTPFSQAKYILNDPTGGADWTTRGNAVETYSEDESPFSNRLIKAYTRTAGTLSAGAGSVATKRFVFPHGYVARTDAYQGLA